MTFAEWKAYAAHVRGIADRAMRLRHERGWALAATVGIPRNIATIFNRLLIVEMVVA